jgi:hypothetical protein
VSRVRENRMHGSTRRREETGTSRASTSRTEPGASRRPDRLPKRSARARFVGSAVVLAVGEARVRPALRRGVPRQADDGAGGGKEQVPAKSKDVRGRVDPEQLIDDAEGAVAGDVESKEAGRADRAVVSEPDERRPGADSR